MIAGDKLGFSVVTYFAYEVIAVAYAAEGRYDDAAVLAAAAGAFFDAGAMARGELGETVRTRLEDVLDGRQPAAAKHVAQQLSRSALLELATD